jgi:hypothetical protein
MPLKKLRFDVFGHQVLIARSNNGWDTFYLGDDGKRRSAPDIVVPSELLESELAQYLDDLCHEWATVQHPDVKQLN